MCASYVARVCVRATTISKCNKFVHLTRHLVHQSHKLHGEMGLAKEALSRFESIPNIEKLPIHRLQPHNLGWPSLARHDLVARNVCCVGL